MKSSSKSSSKISSRLRRVFANISVASTLKGYKASYLQKDILTGIIIAAVSIPISIGYAQISGLPAVYGLYGSVFPILLFALFTTSPQLIFGVDAAPAALVGAALITLGIEPGSAAAISAVPVLTFFTALWLFVFFIFKAGKLVGYISTPVMGGFISGICTTIILMQVPKLMGASAGTGELPELAKHIYEAIPNANIPSIILGAVTLCILLVCKKFFPKFPMAVVLMAVGALITRLTPLTDNFGIKTLDAVTPGLPSFHWPDFSVLPINNAVTISLSVAIVITAETLLAENSFAQKNHYKINDNQELFAFAAGNMAAALTGCCPINGSVSRTAMSEQYEGKTPLTSIVAGVAMIGVLLFATGFIGYLPVPVLTAIVISALIGATEFEVAHKCLKVSLTEFFIFCGAFFGVLMLGTINGVLIGIILSFAEVILRSSKPPRCFLGIRPGHVHFIDMKEFKNAYPIEHVIVYRFSGNLFFANIDVFQKDIEDSIQEDTKGVIVDASGISSIDITAAERLQLLYESLKAKGIRFYMTEHISDLNEQMRKLGIGYMIEEGAARRTINVALKDMGIRKPYPLAGADNKVRSAGQKRAENRVQEFVWAFGEHAEEEIEKQIHIQIEKLKKDGDMDALIHGSWTHMDEMDEDEWLEHLEAHLAEIVRVSGKDEHTLAKYFEQHRQDIRQKIQKEHPELAKRFDERRHVLDTHLKDHHPEVYEKIMKLRKTTNTQDMQ